MTLAFIDGPFALIALFIVVLVCFGPQKVPEIASQIGRALGEFKRATQGFQQSMRLDEPDPYRPSHYVEPEAHTYDSYGNPSDYTSSSSVPEEDLYPASSAEPPSTAHGDFAASALSDGGDEYGFAPPSRASSSSVSAAKAPESPEIATRPADSTVPRNG